MWIVKAALKNPYAGAVLAFMIMVLGVVAVLHIAVDILPAFKAPAVQVMTYYAGMPTSSVEKTITNRIERWTNQATGCQLVESKSTLGVSVVRLYFRDDVDPNGALTQVNSLALGTLPTLPPNTLPPVVLPFDPTGTLPLGVLTVTSRELEETQLKDLARIEVRNMLGGVPGVVAPAVFGGKDRTILIYVNPRELEARNLSPLDVVNALSRSNIMVTPGVAKFGGYEFQLDSNAMVNKVQELRDIPIRLKPGENVYLSNVLLTLIASMSIPLAILCAIIGLYATGNTINAMTLGGLALAIGPLVDDAIVVLENTHRHHALGKSKIKAAFDGAVEVTVPVLVATLTTIIVLCPIALMPGMGGFLFRPLTLAVGFAMLSSFVLSRTFVPALCAKWLVGHTHPGEEHAGAGWGRRIHRPIEMTLHHLNRAYVRLLGGALRYRRSVLTLVGLLFAASLALYLGIGREFFPQVDAGQITIYLRCPAGTNIEAAEKRVADVEHFLEANIPANERQMYISEMGLVPDWSAAYTPNSATWDANIKVQLTDERSKSAQEYAMLLRHAFEKQQTSDPRFADLRVSFDTEGM